MKSKFPSEVIHEGYDRSLALQSVGSGWASLINELFDFIDNNKIKNVKIIQVKEKWGGLRVYTDFINTSLQKKIHELELRSFSVCEVTGDPGRLRNCNGWYRTLSDAVGNKYPIVEK
jgi:hypothetical protein